MSDDQSAPSVPPPQMLMNLLLGVPIVHMIATAVHLEIPARLRAGPLSAEAVAQGAGTLPDTTYRLMRALSTLGILNELSERRFELTAMGACLLPDVPGSFDALARLYGAPWGTEVFTELVHSIRTGESAFIKHHGQPLFAWLERRPAEQALFGRAMSTFSGVESGLVLGAYDFTKVRHIVDVGGGHGALLGAILNAAPAARGTLFDAPAVSELGREALAAAGLSSRCAVVGGDFFESCPPGGDIYLLKHILHDWDDARATQILRQVAGALAPGGRVLVIEQGVAPPGVPAPGKILDIIMLAMLEGRERTTEEHRALFQRAGLRLERAIPTPGPITLFEACLPGA